MLKLPHISKPISQFGWIISDSNNQNEILFLIVFYLIPGTPKDIFTYIAGTLKINLVEFFVITTLARIPSIITSTICGAQISEKNYITALIVFLLTAFVTALCTLAYKKYNDKQKNPD